MGGLGAGCGGRVVISTAGRSVGGGGDAFRARRAFMTARTLSNTGGDLDVAIARSSTGGDPAWLNRPCTTSSITLKIKQLKLVNAKHLKKNVSGLNTDQ